MLREILDWKYNVMDKHFYINLNEFIDVNISE